MNFRLIGLCVVLTGCGRHPSFAPEPRDLAGLHNVYCLTPGVYSGSSPEGDGWSSLRDLGVKTIISVDGATPDLTAARMVGLRYVHLPIGYDGVPEGRAVELAKALRDLPGPVYVHCHHGKHRGPAAVVTALRCLDPALTPTAGEAFLRQAGTDPNYPGLYAACRRTPSVLDRQPVDFPETVAVPRLAEKMVAIDAIWDSLKTQPTASDAIMLLELYREASRLSSADRSAAFRALLAESVIDAERLETAVRTGGDVTAAMKGVGSSCVRCHRRFRDSPTTHPHLGGLDLRGQQP